MKFSLNPREWFGHKPEGGKVDEIKTMREFALKFPRLVNRGERRKAGWRGRVDPDWVQHERDIFMPRYALRHYNPSFFDDFGPGVYTRRQRKARARIKLALARHGLMK